MHYEARRQRPRRKRQRRPSDLQTPVYDPTLRPGQRHHRATGPRVQSDVVAAANDRASAFSSSGWSLWARTFSKLTWRAWSSRSISKMRSVFFCL